MSIFLEKVKEIIADKAQINEELIHPGSNLSIDICLDSLDEVEVVMEIESEYNIHIPDEAAEKFKTVKDITDYLDANITNG